MAANHSDSLACIIFIAEPLPGIYLLLDRLMEPQIIFSFLLLSAPNMSALKGLEGVLCVLYVTVHSKADNHVTATVHE